MAKALRELTAGEALGCTQWKCIDQAVINGFADATDDHQWIHVDEARCASQSPFKSTIAHGLLSTALMPASFYTLIKIDPEKDTLLNYGIDSVRYLEPVRANDRIRYCVSVFSIEKKPTGLLYKFDTTVEIEGREKPAMVGRFLMLLVG